MRIRKVVRRAIDEHHDGVDVVGGLNASVAANVGEKDNPSTHVSSRRRVRVVQKGDRTEVLHDEGTADGGEDG